jgi:8-amino-7-oxononanoate synthase
MWNVWGERHRYDVARWSWITRIAGIRAADETHRGKLSVPQDRNSLDDYARRWLKRRNFDRLSEYNPYFVAIDALRAEMAAHGQTLVTFANYDYLGLAGHARISEAACRAVAQSGPGAGASRLVGGERTAHRAFERALADFLGVGDTLTMVSGYGTNVSLLGHLPGSGDLMIIDDLSHNSIVAGASMSRAETMTFPHNDIDALDRILTERRSRFGRALIVIEGLYSMDGDIPDLPKFLALRDKHNAWLMVDEAHSIGVLGDRGRGIAEHFGLEPSDIDLIVGTLSKTFVSSGGFIAASQIVIEWLRYTLPGFVYSVGLAPPIVAASHAALELLIEEPARIEKLRENARRFLVGAKALGLNTGDSVDGGVVPIIFREIEKTIMVSRGLLDAGYYVPPIFQVGVPKNKPRLRFFISAQHTDDEIDGVLDAMERSISIYSSSAAASG